MSSPRVQYPKPPPPVPAGNNNATAWDNFDNSSEVAVKRSTRSYTDRMYDRGNPGDNMVVLDQHHRHHRTHSNSSRGARNNGNRSPSLSPKICYDSDTGSPWQPSTTTKKKTTVLPIDSSAWATPPRRQSLNQADDTNDAWFVLQQDNGASKKQQQLDSWTTTQPNYNTKAALAGAPTTPSNISIGNHSSETWGQLPPSLGGETAPSPQRRNNKGGGGGQNNIGRTVRHASPLGSANRPIAVMEDAAAATTHNKKTMPPSPSGKEKHGRKGIMRFFGGGGGGEKNAQKNKKQPRKKGGGNDLNVSMDDAIMAASAGDNAIAAASPARSVPVQSWADIPEPAAIMTAAPPTPPPTHLYSQNMMTIPNVTASSSTLVMGHHQYQRAPPHVFGSPDRSSALTTNMPSLSSSHHHVFHDDLADFDEHPKDNFGNVTQKDSNEDTIISEMTDPTFFQRAAAVVVDTHHHHHHHHQAAHAQQRPGRYPAATTTKAESSAAALDPFDVNSPLFAAGGDPFKNFGAMMGPSSPAFGAEPVLSDDFSDPFFPQAQKGSPAKKSNMLSYQHARGLASSENDVPVMKDEDADPRLDHVRLEDESEDEDKKQEEEEFDDEIVARTLHQPLALVQQAKDNPTAAPKRSARATKVMKSRRSPPVAPAQQAPPPAWATPQDASAESSCRVRKKSELPTAAEASPRVGVRTAVEKFDSIERQRRLAMASDHQLQPPSVDAKAQSSSKRAVPRRSKSGSPAVRRSSRQESSPAGRRHESPSSQPPLGRNESNASSTAAAATATTNSKSLKERYQRRTRRSPSPTVREGPAPMTRSGQMPPPPPPPPAVKRTHNVPPNMKELGMSKLTSSSINRRRKSVKAADSRSVSSHEEPPTIKSSGTTDSLTSVGTDIRRLRSIMRRSRKNPDPKMNPKYREPLQSAFAVYDDRQAKDPMQRAGLRLLSAAVVPIQTVVRRHLALREALTRMWAIVVIQTMMRRHFATKTYMATLYIAFRFQSLYRGSIARREWNRVMAVVTIQALYRGGVVRDQLLLDQCCAIEIQRFVRGYLATLRVYETIYMITMVQSVVRRKQAIDHATDRMVLIIQLQSLARGCLTRRGLEEMAVAATVVQTHWRGYSARFNYQLDLLDVLIVQSAIRRKLSWNLFKRLVLYRDDGKATVIQAKWRSSVCRAKYLKYQSDVREVAATIQLQSFARMLLTRMRINKLQACTLSIQKHWRTFNCRFNYQLVLLDVIVIQSLWRQKVAKQLAAGLRAGRLARAATKIQSHWRSYDCTMNYLHFIADVLIVQSAVRRMLVVKRVERIRVDAAITVQRHVRKYLATSGVMSRNAIVIQKCARGFFCMRHIKRVKAAILVQKAWRGFVCYADYMFTIADIVIVQSLARQRIANRQAAEAKNDKKYQGILTLQRFGRSIVLRRALAALAIQRYWRGFVVETEYCIMKYEQRAATMIQSCWRRFWQYSNFIIALDSVISIQAAYRGHVGCRKFEEMLGSAMLIQRIVRSYLVRQSQSRKARTIVLSASSQVIGDYETQCVTTIQSAVRGLQVRKAVRLFTNVRQIQALWRGYQARDSLKIYLNARKVQARWRCQVQRKSYVQFLSARRIQNVWRGRTVYEAYRLYMCARKIQTAWRFHSKHGKYRKFTAARKIQAVWRGKIVSMFYVAYVASRLIQKVWRGSMGRNVAQHKSSARKIQARWRGFTVNQFFIRYMATRYIQKVWRGYTVQQFFVRYMAARRIQKIWRGKTVFQLCREYLAARKIQALWRGEMARIFFLETYAATRIQCNWRRRHARLTFVAYRQQKFADKMPSIILIQRVWRGHAQRCHAPSFTLWLERMRIENFAAEEIQRTWRGYSLKHEYWHLLGSAIQVQTIVRGWIAKTNYQMAVGASVKLQTLFRMILAKKELKQRMFIMMLMNSRLPRPLSRMASPQPYDEKYMKRDRAARVIQRFLLKIKAEVDREIRAEKKRRKAKKKRKTTSSIHQSLDADDDVLENIWNNTIDYKPDKIRRAEEAVAKELSRSRSMQSHNAGNAKGRHVMDGVDMNRSGSSRPSSRPSSRSRERQPIPHHARPPMTLSVHNFIRSFRMEDTRRFRDGNDVSDNHSVISGVSGASSLMFSQRQHHLPPPKMPKSRMTLPGREVDEDLDLETAWIDSEIRNAKERRRQEKRSSKQRTNGGGGGNRGRTSSTSSSVGPLSSLPPSRSGSRQRSRDPVGVSSSTKHHHRRTPSSSSSSQHRRSSRERSSSRTRQSPSLFVQTREV